MILIVWSVRKEEFYVKKTFVYQNIKEKKKIKLNKSAF